MVNIPDQRFFLFIYLQRENECEVIWTDSDTFCTFC